MDRLLDPPAGYDADYVLWQEHQIALLRERKFEQLDLEQLIEELESMVRHERSQLGSRLEVLIMHLLKCAFQEQRKSPSWRRMLDAQRSGIVRLLKQSPSLGVQLMSDAEHEYPMAVRRAMRVTGLPRATFPESLPYTSEQLLDLDFEP